MGQKPRHGEVMRNDDRRETEVGNEAAQEIEKPRLDGHVQPTGRLVHEDEARTGDKIACDLQALTHAAREGTRRVVNSVFSDLDPTQPVDGRGAERRAELEADVQRRELELKKLQQAISASDRERNKARADADALRPLVGEVIKSLGAHLDGALPFKLEDRRAGLTEIQTKLDKGELSAPRALNQLWTFVEDELRLARENGLFQQTIARDGKEELADVIRIGMVMLFFRTNDGAYGYANKSGDAWSYTTLDPAAAKPLGDLFDAFQKQVRTGYFVIPNALPEVKQ